jgi:predicted GNAT family acetyltransferase
MKCDWPELDYQSWQETSSALHLFLQIAGKYRLAHTPWLNHSWNATFYVTPRGLASSPIPDGSGIEILFDLKKHEVIGTSGDGRVASLPLGPMAVADFHAGFVALIRQLGGTPTFDGAPNEVIDPVPFVEDHRLRPYDRDAVTRFHQALVAIDRVFNRFRTSFTGKSSPVHLFWGSFDLAVTRFSGRRAPLHGGGIPALPDHVAQEAYDREVASVGFWPGGNGSDGPAFYAYAYPAPDGFADMEVQPKEAFWHDTLGEFILPYDAVRSAADPEASLLAFLLSTYEAAANLGKWDRELLDCAPGQPRKARRPDAEPAGGMAGALVETIERDDDGSRGRYHLRVEGLEAEMTYRRTGEGVITINHTGVPPALRGRRIGERLVLRAVEDARSEGVKIVPLCPFARAQIDRHPEWQDVLQRS